MALWHQLIENKILREKVRKKLATKCFQRVRIHPNGESFRSNLDTNSIFFSWLRHAKSLDRDARWREVQQAAKVATACAPRGIVQELVSSQIVSELILKWWGAIVGSSKELVKSSYIRWHVLLWSVMLYLPQPNSVLEPQDSALAAEVAARDWVVDSDGARTLSCHAFVQRCIVPLLLLLLEDRTTVEAETFLQNMYTLTFGSDALGAPRTVPCDMGVLLDDPPSISRPVTACSHSGQNAPAHRVYTSLNPLGLRPPAQPNKPTTADRLMRNFSRAISEASDALDTVLTGTPLATLNAAHTPVPRTRIPGPSSPGRSTHTSESRTCGEPWEIQLNELDAQLRRAASPLFAPAIPQRLPSRMQNRSRNGTPSRTMRLPPSASGGRMFIVVAEKAGKSVALNVQEGDGHSVHQEIEKNQHQNRPYPHEVLLQHDARLACECFPVASDTVLAALGAMADQRAHDDKMYGNLVHPPEDDYKLEKVLLTRTAERLQRGDFVRQNSPLISYLQDSTIDTQKLSTKAPVALKQLNTTLKRTDSSKQSTINRTRLATG
eukprot:TRINITY_DN889_c0_g1_i2.p1 TRINITY_DN889_c0_g1~~TRINITY_DN889_c0_g1_i2.p1  ORF type:complete len:558 (+),score=54.04 TRINITY_DN889_c0_g1_i2:25-1674(+)